MERDANSGLCSDCRDFKQLSRETSSLMWRNYRHRRSTWRLRKMEIWSACARSPSSLALPWARSLGNLRRRVRGGCRKGLGETCCHLRLTLTSDLLPSDVTPATFETPEVHPGSGVLGSKPRPQGRDPEDGECVSELTSLVSWSSLAWEPYSCEFSQGHISSLRGSPKYQLLGSETLVWEAEESRPAPNCGEAVFSASGLSLEGEPSTVTSLRPVCQPLPCGLCGLTRLFIDVF